MSISSPARLKETISRKVRYLRESRHWTQVELSSRLGLSQSRLSEIERGLGSFTAEQFLAILRLFNVSVTHFAADKRQPESELQNSLARLGAAHLQESSEVLPSERLEAVGDVVREVLVSADCPRHITSLAPVLVRNIDRTNLKRLQGQFIEIGLERRFAWLIENTLQAVREELSQDLPRKWALSYRRAEVILNAFLTLDQPGHWLSNAIGAPDILDTDIVSAETVAEVQASASAISRRWAIATGIQLEDFVQSLRASRAAH